MCHYTEGQNVGKGQFKKLIGEMKIGVHTHTHTHTHFCFFHHFPPWTQRSKTFSMYTKGLFLSNIVNKSVQICVSEHFSFTEIIHPPHSLSACLQQTVCGLSCASSLEEASFDAVCGVWSVHWQAYSNFLFALFGQINTTSNSAMQLCSFLKWNFIWTVLDCCLKLGAINTCEF